MFKNKLIESSAEIFQTLYKQVLPNSFFQVEKTAKDFEGDFTLVLFPLLKYSKKNPEQTGIEIGTLLSKKLKEIKGFTIVKGFLNISLNDNFWTDFLKDNYNNSTYAFTKEKAGSPVIIEYSSPNTNKPLHLGHIRNNLLGFSLSRILEARGIKVIKANLVNDRGIHICKSMLAWMKWGNGETPASSGLKGDHLIGKYYVLFNQKYLAEVKDLVKKGLSEELAEKQAPLLLEAQELLNKWENNDKETRLTWQTLNNWVYDGFKETYKLLGVDFDKTWYESDTYITGKDIILNGLKNNTFIQKNDGSVWIDLTDEGLDEKLLLRSDGTSVYITQDLGTALLRYEEYKPQKMIYVVGNEQNYHFDVLKKIIKKTGWDWEKVIYHLSYGMVELPDGKMKSREGTVVDADDLISEMIKIAASINEVLGKTTNFDLPSAIELHKTIALGALKYFILKVDPKKNIIFNPEESIDFNGNTGPFIQYTFARINSLLIKGDYSNKQDLLLNTGIEILPQEKAILKSIYEFPEILNLSASTYNPALIANYVYELAKIYNQFYQEIPVLKEENKNIKLFRLNLSYFTANVIKNAMYLLGINVPLKM